MSIQLSILIPSVHTRRNTFLPKIQDEIYRQIDELTEEEQAKVEFITLIDNKKRMLGSKRNDLVTLSQGKYYVFVDDDDRISPTYIKSILEATEHDCDVITFNADVSINGGNPKKCIYGNQFNADRDMPNEYHRIPNHICAVKRSVGIKVSFPDIKYGEDSAYSKLLKPLLKSKYHIDSTLYFYDFNTETTETQENIVTNRNILRPSIKPIVDVVFLSNAKDNRYKEMCQRAIDTCLSGANGLQINIIVIEQNKEVSYRNAKTIHNTSPIHYNRFMNQGAGYGSAEWIMFCNSDLIFHNAWLHNLLTANHPIVSPKSPKDPRQRDVTVNEIGDVCGRNLSGWSFMMKRSLYNKIGKLPEITNFWFSDNATIQECKKIGIKPMLVPSSIVTHIGSETLKTLDKSTADSITWEQCKIYNEYYKENHFEDNPNYQAWLRNQK